MSNLGIKLNESDIIKSVLTNINLWRIFLIDIIFMFVIIVFYNEEFLLAVFLGIMFMLCLFVLTPDHYREIFFFAIAFPIVEIICILFGVWQYTITSIFVIPFWLFPAWGQASLTIIYMSKELQKQLFIN